MAPLLAPCTRDELPALVSALDAEFVTARGRTLSLAVRFPHLFEPGRLHHLYALREGPKLLACAIARPFTWVVAERPWRCAMLGMVYTAPTSRGQGYASRVLEGVLQSLRATEFDVAVLWSALEGFYETRGWQPGDCGVLGTVRRTVAAPGTATPRTASVGLVSSNAAADAIRQCAGPPFIARSELAWQALPIPITHCELAMSANAYALIGRHGAHAYLYEMLGRPTDFRDLWQQCTHDTSQIKINAPPHSASYRWLSSHTSVTWQPQRLTFWYPLSAPSQRLALNSWYIPYFDRI